MVKANDHEAKGNLALAALCGDVHGSEQAEAAIAKGWGVGAVARQGPFTREAKAGRRAKCIPIMDLLRQWRQSSVEHRLPCDVEHQPAIAFPGMDIAGDGDHQWLGTIPGASIRRVLHRTKQQYGYRTNQPMKRLALLLCLIPIAACACEHGDTIPVWIMPHYDITNWYQVPVDRCIAPIVQALNSNGIVTLSSCCGHGTNGFIRLENRILIVTPYTNREAAYRLYRKDWEGFSRDMWTVTRKIQLDKEARDRKLKP